MVVGSGFAITLSRFAYRLEEYWQRLFAKGTRFDSARFRPTYRRLWENAACSLRAEFTEIAEGFWRVQSGSKSTLIHEHLIQADNPVVLSLAGNKALCHQLLMAEGISVPDHVVFELREFWKAEAFVARHTGEYFVVKPAVGTAASQGVTLYVRSIWQCWLASIRASLLCDKIIVERFIAGQCYRLLFLGGEMIDAIRERGVWVCGDGISTLRQLVKRQCHNNDSDLCRTNRDPDYRATLASQGLDTGCVPKEGSRVLVKSSLGWNGQRCDMLAENNERVTELICVDVREEAARAIRALRAEFATVEIITTDPGVSLTSSRGAIIEINTTPGLHRHCRLGTADSVALEVLRYLLNGSNGSNSSSRLLATRILERGLYE